MKYDGVSGGNVIVCRPIQTQLLSLALNRWVCFEPLELNSGHIDDVYTIQPLFEFSCLENAMVSPARALDEAVIHAQFRR